jgi:hypothetical protein
MRTKRLLIAAAALAAGVLSSQAQSNVYSANIVGYVNQPIPLGFNLLVNPLNTGASNGVNEVFGNLPDGSTVLTWTGNSFSVAIYDTTIGISANNWYQSDGFTPLNAIPTVPPGKGFFFSPGTVVTNTFVGTVVPAPGATNSLAIPNGFSIVGSVLPVSGDVTNSAINLPLPDGAAVLKWAGNHYVTYIYDTTIGISANNWYLSDGFTPGPVPSIAVAEGFFFNPGVAVNWTQVLQ